LIHFFFFLGIVGSKITGTFKFEFIFVAENESLTKHCLLCLHIILPFMMWAIGDVARLGKV
jgi:hypothetical protein